jgi:hypothetical protein
VPVKQSFDKGKLILISFEYALFSRILAFSGVKWHENCLKKPLLSIRDSRQG